MFVNYLPYNNGKLFIFPDEKIRSFWMKNTLISLDVLFLNKDMQIVGIVKNTKPLSHNSISVNKPSKYVLEISSGWVNHKNAKMGDYIYPILKK